MATITDTKVVTCNPQPAEAVSVTPTIGEAQEGAWAVLLDGALVAGGVDATAVALGTGDALRGKVVEVSAVIKDIQGATDRLSLRTRVSALADPIDISHAGAPGDAALYSVIIFFGG